MIEDQNVRDSSKATEEVPILESSNSGNENLKQNKIRKNTECIISQSSVDVNQSCHRTRSSCISIFCQTAGIIALIISAIHLYCDYRQVDRLSLMISGFNFVTYHDSTGLLPERTIYVDLAFINNGNQHQTVLDARYAFPESADFPNVYWNMCIEKAHLEPFTIAPGETAIRRLEQQIDEASLIGDKQFAPDSSSLADIPNRRILAIEITVITPSDLPGQRIIPIAEFSTESLISGSISFYRNVQTQNPFGAVLFYENIFDSLTIGRSCMIDTHRMVI